MRFDAIFCAFALTVSASRGLAFDSARTVAMDGVMTEGRMLTSSVDTAARYAEIKQQLNYATGHLGHDAMSMIELERSLAVEITGVEAAGRDAEQDLFVVHYVARANFAWKRPADLSVLPSSYALILPMRADVRGLKDFAARYGPGCGGSVDPNALWYYYNPTLAACALRQNPAPLDVLRLPVALSISDRNTSGKKPEYGAVWSDGSLDVFFFANNEQREGAVHAGERLIRLMEGAYGPPLYSSIEPHGYYNWLSAAFAGPAGPINVQAVDFLLGEIFQADMALTERIGHASAASDLVAYNGHAGLGAYVRAFTHLTRFTPERYYVYWINACRPYAYLDATLELAAQAANPNDSASRYLDLLSSTGIGVFAQGEDVLDLIAVFNSQTATFRELTARLPRGSPAVIGEEDNPD
jgi:hypothetical protein